MRATAVDRSGRDVFLLKVRGRDLCERRILGLTAAMTAAIRASGSFDCTQIACGGRGSQGDVRVDCAEARAAIFVLTRAIFVMQE
jgi:hypothetical protein